MIIIGLDPHPGTHTAVALDAHGAQLAHLTVPNTPQGTHTLHAWAQQYPHRTWAIEGAGSSYTRELIAHLWSQHETLHAVPATLTSQYRSRRTSSKDDIIDAQNAARALLANPTLPRWESVEDREQLQNLTRNRERLSQDRKAHDLARRELPAGEAGQVMRDVLGQVIDTLDQAMKRIDAQLRALVRKHAPQLLDVLGVGPVLAASLLAEVGDVRRFASQHAFARYCGAAPVARGSGGTTRWCVSRGGNRRLNRVLHLVLLTRYRCDPRTRAYVERKRAEGKTMREAFRALKTVIARELFHALHPAPTP